ncbi:unnamed protein product [Ceutorhynchus assimilis]|uniref:Tubulin delta chain n=1 Tax=Ceutorhynchus assimilis TaxID=467358 RepID=A0A9N9MM39_9CUCU|nr:unnamed protein product [Ceutorhynchus assimilis]
MSVITLNFGQCGNQIGQTLYTTLEEDITLKTTNSQHYCQSLAKWFNVDSKGRWKARSILVDTESKVIKDIKKSWFENIIVNPVGGSANNWAYGYVENSRLVVGQVLNLVRKELENCDFVTSFLNFYSLSGGTGSGVGSYVIEKLRNEYPKNTIVNCAVLPYVKGEISTQAYNCLLNLSTLYSIGDCTVLFENERLLHLSKYSLNLNAVNYSNINSIISQQVASIFQPLGTVTTSSLLQNLISHPQFKFLQIKTEPNISNQNSAFETPQQCTALMNNLLRQSRFDHAQTNKYSHFKVISKALIHRGLEKVPEYELKSFKETRDLVKWLPQEESVRVYSVPERFCYYPNHLSVLFNDNNILTPLNAIVDDAWTLFTHRAYLHHYSKYGLDEEYLLNSFQIMENVLNNYRMI